MDNFILDLYSINKPVLASTFCVSTKKKVPWRIKFYEECGMEKRYIFVLLNNTVLY